jgi:hypothetical protein
MSTSAVQIGVGNNKILAACIQSEQHNAQLLARTRQRIALIKTATLRSEERKSGYLAQFEDPWRPGKIG